MGPSWNTSGSTEVSPADSSNFSAVTWDWFSIIQLILAVFGILGNSLVITVYFKKLRVRSNSNKLIALLAVADLLTSVATIPFPDLSFVPNTAGGRVYCRLLHSKLIMWIAIVASVLTLTLLSLERFFAVVHPVKHKSVFSKPNIKYFVAVVWVSAIILNTGSFYVPNVGEEHFCYLNWPSPGFQAFYGIALFTLEFFMPVSVMIVSHFFAVRGLKKQAASLLERNKSTSSPAFSLLQARRQVIRIILTVVITFIVCWGPDQVGFLVYNLGGLSPAYFSSLTYRSFTVLAFLNSCANPVIYIGLNKNFRLALAQLVPYTKTRVGSTSEEATGTIRLGESVQGMCHGESPPKTGPMNGRQEKHARSDKMCVVSCS